MTGLLGLCPAPATAKPPPETRRIRLIKITGICVAPQYVADDLLHAEGFTDVEYIPATAGIEAAKTVGSGTADITITVQGAEGRPCRRPRRHTAPNHGVQPAGERR
jgi:NitT/TauT family transport system substrate-binding protein